MSIYTELPITAFFDHTRVILHELGVPVHRNGYRQLGVAIPCFALDDTQSLSKELYPYVAARFGHTDWRCVEHAIRLVILDAWDRRDPEVWEQYFPNCRKPPSNKQFIATLAERVNQITPPVSGRG